MSELSNMWPVTVWRGSLDVSCDPEKRGATLAEVASQLTGYSLKVEHYECLSLEELPQMPWESAPSAFRLWMLEEGASGSSQLEVLLHDPRVSSTMVGFPGMPWGRGMRMSLSSNSFMLHPGPLTYTVLPGKDARSGQLVMVDLTIQVATDGIERE